VSLLLKSKKIFHLKNSINSILLRQLSTKKGRLLMERINISENGIYLVFEVDEEQCLKLLHFSAQPFREEDIAASSTKDGFRLVEMNLAGFDRPSERHGNKYIVTAPGYRLKYRGLNDEVNKIGRKLVFKLEDEETALEVEAVLQFYNDLSIIRCWNTVSNFGTETQTIEYLSSFNYTGIAKEGKLLQQEKLELALPHNSWQREMNWQQYSLTELGLELVQPPAEQRSSSSFKVFNTGNWSSKEYLPMAYLANKASNTGLFWQIEHNGSWYWEIGDQNGHLYLALSGPNEIYSHWSKNIKPGETFTTVPAAVGVTESGFADAMATLTNYRRRIRRKNADNEKLGVIFNDYMNCLWGKPTAEAEFPLIDAAAEVGCEYYCIDAGWYADGKWWDEVGAWQESKKRFPNGLVEVTNYIKEKGMVPGLWLEIEVMGINSPLIEELPADCFFTRHGKKVFDRSRYQLDYRKQAVRDYATSVIDRLINDYGVGYFKMDYNIEPGIGTEIEADSYGAGLLEHERAYLSWLDGIFSKYPDLIIENCSSGGLRIDYAMLSRYSIQSTSDQEDYRYYATIAANAPAGLTPEQSAVWSYPLANAGREEVVFNMINAILLRIHQSGHLAELSTLNRRLVKEAITLYKTIRSELKTAVPIWPLGLANFSSEWLSMGLKNDHKIYLAVWKRKSDQTNCKLPFVELQNKEVTVNLLYPNFAAENYKWDSSQGELIVELNEDYQARLFEIEF
jgi:alpha-galactosidase